MGKPDTDALIESLLECGVIPESFGHDSSEEKLYAKYCDLLLASAFNGMGIESVVIEERANSADVAGKTSQYSIVGDTKAFRLSRTAKNQKDFKVTSLSSWRGARDYACLVCPIYQYPTTRSQIYTQAIGSNVTLLGYVHLTFMVEYSRKSNPDLSAVWHVGRSIPPSNEATAYWRAIDSAVCDAIGKSALDLDEFKDREREVLEKIKTFEIEYLQTQIKGVMALTKRQAVQCLISERNLPARIEQIRKTAY